MPRPWRRYLSNSYTDAGRAIVEQGKRLDEARRSLPEDSYLRLLADVGITPRDARVLAIIGQRLHSVITSDLRIRLPYRVRTLSALSDLSSETLAKATEDGKIHPAMTESEVKRLRGTSPRPVSTVIRPTDNWNFSTLRWPRIDGWEGHGYIPGDLYANCLWYYAREGDIVVDPMAGSGMLLRVWEERGEWLQGEDRSIEIKLADLAPRGPYASQIQWCDLLDRLPTDHSDYVIIDPPYYGLVNGQYSDSPNDLANMDADAWLEAMATIAVQFHKSQPESGRCTVIVPNNRNITTGERTLFPEIVHRIFQNAGYFLYDKAYASRRTQQKQGRQMGILNNRARREKVPLADISEVLTFINGNPFSADNS